MDMDTVNSHPLAISSAFFYKHSKQSIVEEGYGLFSNNTVILAFMVCGIITTILEFLGVLPLMKITDLFLDEVAPETPSDMTRVIYRISEGVELARLYTVHIYLAAYILLPYPLITEKQKVLLTPWLLSGVLRSLLLIVLQSLSGVVLCASKDYLHLPCLQYAAINGAELCFSLYLWMSVHSFYHLLDRNRSTQKLGSVLKTIHAVGRRHRQRERNSESYSCGSADSIRSSGLLLSIDSVMDECLDELLPGTEATLIERAAMAWIAREILESGADYVTDAQFSAYLTIKASMELRQVVRELTDRRREERRSEGPPHSVDHRIMESLEFCRKMAEQDNLSEEIMNEISPKLQAFDQSAVLSKRDPIRRLRPLTVGGRPFSESEVSGDGTIDPLWDKDSSLGSPSHDSSQTMTPDVVEAEDAGVQTEPLGLDVRRIMDALDKQYTDHLERRKDKDQ